jgi:hypothetical protein
LLFLLLLTNFPLVANALRKGSSMFSSNLVRVGGLAAVATGLLLELLGAYPENFSEEALTTTYTVQSLMWLISALLLLVALAGLHARQSEAAGALGLAGFIAALIGTGLFVGSVWTNTFIPPALAVEAPAVLDAEPTGSLAFGFYFSFIVFGLCWALFRMGMLRARVYPRVAAIVLIIGALILPAPLPASGFVLEAALI